MLSTASYDARKFGVRSGMPGPYSSSRRLCSRLTKQVLGFIAKKLCPELIMVDHHFNHYIDVSGKIMNIFREYDPNMSAAGCDEGYLKCVRMPTIILIELTVGGHSITEYCRTNNMDVAECVQQMRDRVREEMNLTVSAGIAPNMVRSSGVESPLY